MDITLDPHGAAKCYVLEDKRSQRSPSTNGKFRHDVNFMLKYGKKNEEN